MVRWEHRYTHDISTNVSLRMSTDSQLCMRPMPIAGCAMSRVKTTAMSVFSNVLILCKQHDLLKSYNVYANYDVDP